MSVAITVQTDELHSFQEELAQFGVIAKKQVLPAMGAGVRKSLVDHFAEIERDSVHHHWSSQLGAGRTHFYDSAARGVQLPHVEGNDSVLISINNIGIAQRYFGGVISAKNKKWLTIPAVAAAYGKSANSFNNLHFVLFRPDLAALVETLSKATTTARNGVIKSAGEKAERGRVIYWLKKEVTQEGDPSVLPTDDEMAEGAIEAGKDALAALPSFKPG